MVSKQPAKYKIFSFLAIFILWTASFITPDHVVLAAPNNAPPVNWYVTTTGDDSNTCNAIGSPCLTINGAIGKAALGDIIHVAAGTYYGTGAEVVLVNKSVTLSGGWDVSFTSQNSTSTIDAQGARRGIVVTSGITATIAFFTVQNGFHATQGGGIWNEGILTVNNSIIRNNISHWMGGGLYSYGTLTINSSTIDSNSAGQTGHSGGGGGGGIHNYDGTLTLNNSTVSNNIILGSFNGSAISNFDVVIVNNSTISNNTNKPSVYSFVGNITLENVTISGNTSGGIEYLAGTLSINNSTVTNNLTGIYNAPPYSGVVNIVNSIVSNNTSYDCYGTITSGGYNLIGNNTSCTFVAKTGDLVGTNAAPIDPGLLSLQNNGGSTFTHALKWGSPAIDAGNPTVPGGGGNSCLATDQRGVARPIDDNVVVGAVCDIGAFEFNDPTPQVLILPDDYYTNEQTDINLHGTGISVGDINDDPLTLTISGTDGNSQFTANVGTTGVVISSGNGTSSLELTGSVAQLNSFLAGNLGATLTYRMEDDTPAASDSLTITADDGSLSGSDTATINITAVNDPPVNTIPPVQTTNEDTALVFSLGNSNQISISDPDINTNNMEVTLSITNGTLTLAGITGLSFVTGDGTSDSTMVFNGILNDINTALATLTFNPTANYNSAAVLSITTSDFGHAGTGGVLTDTDTVNITINAVNDLPTVINPIPNQNATEDVDFNFQFAANTFADIDIGDSLTYSAQLAGGGALPAWLNFNPATRTFSGIPANSDVGIITIMVTAEDGSSQTAFDNFDLTVANSNDTPTVANAIPNQNAIENTPFNFQFAVNAFSDPDVGDTLTYSAQLNGGGALPAWLSFDAVTRTFSGTPTNSDVGTISIDVIADDGNGGSVADTFSIMVSGVNDAPFVFTPIPNQNATEDSFFSFAFDANTFRDPDIGDTLTYTAQLAGGGTLPAWLTFNAATRTFSGTPVNADVGTITIEVTAEDSTNQTVSDNFDLVVANSNDSPSVANPIPNQNASENTMFNFQFAVNTFSDPDVGDTLTYSAQLNGGGALPAWLVFDTVTRTFSGTPTSSYIGTVSIDVIADDGNGGTVTDTFNIVVTNGNNPPVVANPIPDQTTNEGATFNFQFTANTFSDPNNDPLTYSAQLNGGGALPAWVSFDAVTRTFSGTPTNSDIGIISIDVIADDGNGGTVTDTFNITVVDVNPVVTSVNVTNPDGTYNIGSTISVTITFDQTVFVDTTNGTPTLLLETSATDRLASYISGSGSTTLTFNYTVQIGDITPDLDYQSTTALVLNGGTITSTTSDPATLTLPATGSPTSIAGQHNIIIDGVAFNVAATSLASSYTTGPITFTVTFGDDASDPSGDIDTDDVTNPANYLLVEDGANGIFDTKSCLGRLTTDDTQIAVSTVTYFSKTAVVTLSTTPPVGNYRLFICGTTSIVDLAGNPLAGNGVTPGTDYIVDFTVGATTGPGTGSTSSETGRIAASSLPATGFAPNRITTLPPQPATLAYAELGDLWLEIPALNLKTAIVGVPQTNGNWDVSWLGNDTGWLNGTAFPTWTGNSVLTAHVTNASGLPGPFAELKKLKYGDQVIVHMGGVRYIYEIRASKLTRPFATNFAYESLQNHSYLTLITCQVYLPTNDTYLFRRVIRAVLVSVEEE